MPLPNPSSDKLPDLPDPDRELSKKLQELMNDPDMQAQAFVAFERLSAEKILALASWVKIKDTFSLGMKRCIVHAALYHTDAKHLPSKMIVPPSTNDASERALAAMAVLYQTTYLIPELPELEDQLLAAWPSLFRWYQYLYTQRVEKGSDPKSMRRTILFISYLLWEWILIPSLHAKLRSTPGIIRLMVRLWSHKDADVDVQTVSSIIHHGLRPIEDKVTAEEVLAASDSSDKMAKLAIKRLNDETAHNPLRPEELGNVLMVVGVLSNVSPHPLSTSFLSEHTAFHISRTLFKIAQEHKKSPQTPGDLDKPFTYGVVLLLGFLTRTDGFTWVREALNGNILQALCGYATEFMLLRQPAKDAVRKILGSILPKFMVYLSVVHAFDKEIEEIEGAYGDDDIRESFVSEEWNELIGLGRSRAIIKGFKSGMKKTRGCEYVKCRRMSGDVKLRRCTGCLTVFYCSKECQTNAWPDHKRMCKAKKDAARLAIEEGGEKMFLDSDANFIKALMAYDARVHLPHLRKLASKKHPNEKHPENFVICLDYTNDDYIGGTCSLKNIWTYKFQTFDEDDEDYTFRDTTNRFNDEMIKKARENPLLYTFIEGTIAYGNGKQVRNIMVSPNWWNTLEHNPSVLDWFNKKCEHGNAPGFFDVVGGL